MKKNNYVQVNGGGKKLEKLPKALLDVLSKFLDIKDIAQLLGKNRWLHENIIGNPANQESGPLAKEQIKIAKTRFDEKIYMVLYKVAKTQCKELLTTGNYFVIGEAQNLCDGYIDIFVTVILEQLIFFDTWSMGRSLSGLDQSSMSYLKDFLNKDEIKARKKILLGKQYTIDNLSRYDWCDVFADFVEVYFQKIKDDLSKNINFGKDIKAKIKSEFIKFWLWQLSQLDTEIKNQEDESGAMKKRGGVYSDFRDIIEIMESSLFNPNKNFSITFEEFINSLR